MKNSLLRTFLLVGLIFTLSSVNNLAQFNDYTVKLGIQPNLIITDTEFDKDLRPSEADYKFSGLGRLFLRFEFFTETLEAEVGGGFGRLAGVDTQNENWWSYIIPFDFRFVLSPFEVDVWNPYMYAGVGGSYFFVDKKPTIPSPQATEESGFTTIFPLGAGFEIGVSDAFIIDFSGGYTFTLSDDLNGYNNKDVPNTDQAYDGYFNVGIGFTLVNGYGGSDNDEDGLIKRTELEIGTNPDNPDSDRDGLNDGDEVNIHSTDPLDADTDGDNLKDGIEVNAHQTNPNLADSDNDKLNDGDEVNTHNTDPLDNDSDNDLLDDGTEVNKYKTDPMNPDSDNDGLSDGDEVNVHITDPSKKDTDNDGLTDGDEVNKYQTHPLKSDSDEEGLMDGEEINKYLTDPLNADTDGGTVDDFTEVQRGTDPLNADDDVMKVNVPIVLEGITFATGKADITPESEKVLEGALKTLETYPDIIVEISGHTDNVGSNASNQKLSQRRADSVRFWLISKGIDPDRIIAKGYGEEFPRVPNDTADHKRMNRRIEFKRIK